MHRTQQHQRQRCSRRQAHAASKHVIADAIYALFLYLGIVRFQVSSINIATILREFSRDP